MVWSTGRSYGSCLWQENSLLLTLFWGQQKVMGAPSFFSLKSIIKGLEPSESGGVFQHSSVGFGGFSGMWSHQGHDTLALVGVGLLKRDSRFLNSLGKAACCGPKAEEQVPSWAVVVFVLGGGIGGGGWSRETELWGNGQGWGWVGMNKTVVAAQLQLAQTWCRKPFCGPTWVRADHLLLMLEFGLQQLVPCLANGNQWKTLNWGAPSKGSQRTRQEFVWGSLRRYLIPDCDCYFLSCTFSWDF